MNDGIVLTDAPDLAARDDLLRHLIAFNTAKAGAPESRPLALLIHNSAGEVAGGLWARTGWGWMFVELLFVPEDRRGSGLGRDLLLRAEEEAWRRGCRDVWLDTFSFQARGFYEKSGYRVFGTLENYPPGHSRFFLQKALTAPDTR